MQLNINGKEHTVEVKHENMFSTVYSHTLNKLFTVPTAWLKNTNNISIAVGSDILRRVEEKEESV